jgi:hypothetical protein
MNIILGKGQVGNALKRLMNGEKRIYDKGKWENLKTKFKEVATLNITIPFSDDFIKIVEKACKIFDPLYLVIHSTVEPTTTEKIQHPNKIYSPIMGRHDDNFEDNILFYKKPFAGSKNDFQSIRYLYNTSVDYWNENTSELEFAKIMSTAYMYWNLLYQKILKKECDDRKYDFYNVYTRWNENYNYGIKKLHECWQRPIYYFDRRKKPSGHCLANNVYLSNDMINKILQKWQSGKLTFY